MFFPFFLTSMDCKLVEDSVSSHQDEKESNEQLDQQDTSTPSLETAKEQYRTYCGELRECEAFINRATEILDAEKRKNDERKRLLDLASTKQEEIEAMVSQLAELEREKQDALEKVQELGQPKAQELLTMELQSLQMRLHALKPGTEKPLQVYRRRHRRQISDRNSIA